MQRNKGDVGKVRPDMALKESSDRARQFRSHLVGMRVSSLRSAIGMKSVDHTVVPGGGSSIAAGLESAPVNKSAALREMASLLTSQAHHGESRAAVNAENCRNVTCSWRCAS